MEPLPLKRINFYKLSESYGKFSNYYKSPFELEGKTWPTVEHYFQAQKHVCTPLEEKIRLAPQPAIAKRLGRLQKMIRPDWEEVKVEVMYRGCKAKFETNPKLKKMLLNTGDAYLAEHTKNDKFWADGGDDSGQNHLGKILMKLRDEFKKAEEEPAE